MNRRDFLGSLKALALIPIGLAMGQRDESDEYHECCGNCKSWYVREPFDTPVMAHSNLGVAYPLYSGTCDCGALQEWRCSCGKEHRSKRADWSDSLACKHFRNAKLPEYRKGR